MKATKYLSRLFALSVCLVMVLMLFSIQPAYAESPNIVISQVYGGGGNTGATYKNDFIELYNRGDTPASVAGWSVQYASATSTGNFGSATNLITELPPITLAPGQYLLIQEAQGAGGTVDLPTPDVTDATPVNMNATAGKVALVNSVTPLGCNGSSTPCSPAQLAKIVDLLGWGSANFYETAAAPATANATASLRNGNGCNETDNNSVDFSTGAPTPRNTASPVSSCAPSEPKINEFSASTTGTDVEWVEVFGSVNADYSAYRVLEIEGDTTGAGMVDEVISVGTTDAAGFWLANLSENTLENGTITLLLVKDFTGVLNNDLDTNNDGVFDVTPWSLVADEVAVNDGGVGDRTYGIPFLGPNYDGLSSFAPGGASRIPDGYDTEATSDWVRNDFDLAGITGYAGTIILGEAYNTPGAPNAIYVPPPEACGDPFTPIYEVQGSGLTSPLVGTEVALEGTVVGDFQNNGLPDSGDLNGFYLQDPTGDGNTATSNGVFIYAPGAADVAVGDGVRVRGTVSEYYDLTEVSVSQLWICSSGNSVAPTPLTLPVATLDDFEAYEGMLVNFPQALEIAEYFNYDRYGEIVLGLPFEGQSRLYTPTSVVEPGAPAIDLALQNSLRRITLDDVQSAQNPITLRHPNGQPFSLSNLFRGGDLVQNAVGVLGYDFSLYRIMPTGPAEYTAFNPRPTEPEEVGGRLQIAAMNTLNYFLTLDYPSGDLDNKCGPDLNMECRGADADQPLEFDRQRTKLLAALSGLDAAVIGLNEMENTTGVEPLADIVAGLNAILGEGTYAYIDTGVIGTDAIRVGMIYQPGLVTPVGDFKLLTTAVDPRFLDDYNRPTMAQTFEENSTGERFTMVVNHLKSKGSDCNSIGDPDTGDGQGNCNLTRMAAAQAMVDWLATDPTGSGDPDFIIMGDLNSYAMEDPIDAILAGGDDMLRTADDYANLILQYQGLYAYSYVFDGQNGYLDHALANGHLAAQVTGATEWHINADEPDVLDYDTSFKPSAQEALYEPNAYRSSDHDAILVGLDLVSTIDGFVTGGGWIDSPAGAYLADPSLIGKGEFSFDAKYVKHNPLPVGAVDYMIKKAGLYFTGTGFDWLVVNGQSAWLRGTGMFNGADGYSFMLTVADGDDYFRLQIWELASGMLVYDNQPGDAEFAPATTPLGGGKIMCHKSG